MQQLSGFNIQGVEVTYFICIFPLKAAVFIILKKKQIQTLELSATQSRSSAFKSFVVVGILSHMVGNNSTDIYW